MKSKFSYLGLGLVTGALLASSVTSKVLESRVERQTADNLTKNVVQVTDTRQIETKTTRNILLEDNLKREEAVIIAYADSIAMHSWKLPISSSDYLRYKGLSHRTNSLEEYVSFVTFDDDTIKKIAEGLTQYAKSKEEKAKILLNYVHQHMYDESIEKNENYIKYPIETIVERCGDCEDLSILGAALMKSVGIDVALIYVPDAGEDKKTGIRFAHMALGVAGDFQGGYFNVEGNKYFYAETTGTDWLNDQASWEIGQLPSEYEKKKCELFLVR